jgi:glycerol-3-phosphate acyltransferase PlsX
LGSEIDRSVNDHERQVIGVDLAGADVHQLSLFAACYEAAADADVCLRCYLSTPAQSSFPSIECISCSETITMYDEALSAVRAKKDSSLVKAMIDVKKGNISALVTCANTGAVTAAAVIHLKRFPHLHHPALIAELPLPCGTVIALDMGAFVTATGRDLFSYARLGSAYATLCHAIVRPRVGLLNIGREAGRGTEEVKQADRYCSENVTEKWEYVGNVEPSDVLSGAVDVVVAAGFSGNIFLKTVEAMAKLAKSPSIPPKARGALLGGVRGVVIKCHGLSNKEALITAIRQAKATVEAHVVPRLELEEIYTQTR